MVYRRSERLFDVLAEGGEVTLHRLRIVILHNLLQLAQLLAYLLKLGGSVGVEHDLAQEMVVFAEHTTRDVEVAFEGGARSILMLHYPRKHECGGERDSQRVGLSKWFFVSKRWNQHWQMELKRTN